MMISTLVAVMSVAVASPYEVNPGFVASQILREAGFAYNADRSSAATSIWIAERSGTTVRISLGRYRMNGEPVPEASREYLMSRVTTFSLDRSETGFSQDPIGVKEATNWFDQAEGRFSLYTFGTFRTLRIHAHGRGFIEGSKTRLVEIPSSVQQAVESFSRWQLAQAEDTAEAIEISRAGRIYKGRRGPGGDRVAFRTYAAAQGWSEWETPTAGMIALRTSKGDLIIHVGSDAIEFNGEVIRTGHIHPAKGDEVYLPVSFLDGKGL